jgi:hypothetical protein
MAKTSPGGPRSERFRRLHVERQAAKRVNERAIAAAHQRASGPDVTASSERQPQHQRPRVKVPSR